jgi:hypothetical protein
MFSRWWLGHLSADTLELPYEIYLNRTLAPAKVRLLVFGGDRLDVALILGGCLTLKNVR